MENQNPDFELQEGYNILTVNHLYLKRLVHKDLNIIFNELTLMGLVQDSAVFNDPDNQRFIIFGTTDKCVLDVVIKYLSMHIAVEKLKFCHAFDK